MGPHRSVSDHLLEPACVRAPEALSMNSSAGVYTGVPGERRLPLLAS